MTLKWFSSYLSDRQQKVTIGADESEGQRVGCGVPQGSVLGPLLFTLYSAPIGDICRKHGLQYHLYADDTQLYLTFKINAPGKDSEALKKVEACIAEIRIWMVRNALKLNDDKTEFLVIAAPRQQDKVSVSGIGIGDSRVEPSSYARNLGVAFDREMNMEMQVKNVCSSAMAHLRNIIDVRASLTQDAAERLVHALVTSRIDSGNALLYGIPAIQLDKIQSILGVAARVVCGARKHESTDRILERLHWLPTDRGYNIKSFFRLSNPYLAPPYLDELLVVHQPQRSLRSNQHLTL